MKSRFETKLGYFVKRYCTFAYCYLSTHFLNLMTPDLLWKGSHIHIFTVIFVISIILMNADNLHIETCRFKPLLMVSIIKSRHRDNFKIIFITSYRESLLDSLLHSFF